MPGLIRKIIFFFVRVFYPISPIGTNSGSDDAIVKKSRELFEFYRKAYSDFDAESALNQDIQWLESFKITPKNQIKELDLIVKHAKMFTSGDVEIGHVRIDETVAKIDDNDLKNVIMLAEKEQSDLLAGKYEGGLKVWECTSDLVGYFEENKDKIVFEDKEVLDLGCGTGILGIYAILNKAKVTFQDYNKEVIEHATIPNVLLNIEEDQRETEINKCTFYSGDWESFNNKCNNVFDIITTSETIYNENNYEKLLNIFLDRLTKDGSVYVAAKTYYFGVGGGTRLFEQVIKNNGSLKSEVCWTSTDGIQREILKITRKV